MWDAGGGSGGSGGLCWGGSSGGGLLVLGGWGLDLTVADLGQDGVCSSKGSKSEGGDDRELHC